MLTATAIKSAKPKDKQYKLFDERGLFLIITTKGGKWWRFKYIFDGKEKLLSLGIYPDISLQDARERREEARKLVAKGIDPSQEKQSQRLINLLKEVALEWLSRQKPRWKDSHTKDVVNRLNKNIFPFLGQRPIASITPTELLGVIRKIEVRGSHEVASRTLGICSQIYRYAIVTEKVDRDITIGIKEALIKPEQGHFAAATTPHDLARVLKSIESYPGNPVNKIGLKLLALTFVRTIEIMTATWSQIDFETKLWCFVASKTNPAHIVPLSKQVIALLEELRTMTDWSPYLFPGSKPGKTIGIQS